MLVACCPRCCPRWPERTRTPEEWTSGRPLPSETHLVNRRQGITPDPCCTTLRSFSCMPCANARPSAPAPTLVTVVFEPPARFGASGRVEIADLELFERARSAKSGPVITFSRRLGTPARCLDGQRRGPDRGAAAGTGAAPVTDARFRGYPLDPTTEPRLALGVASPARSSKTGEGAARRPRLPAKPSRKSGGWLGLGR
jgi:hypothetical protein